MPAKKDPNKPRGRMTAYAFFVQTCRAEHKKCHPNEQVVFSEFSKKCAARWKPMSDTEKKAFNEMAEKDRLRFNSEMKDYTPVGGDGKRKRKKKKDPNAPKRPQSAFFLYCADHRNTIKQANPGFTVGEIAKTLGKQWGGVTAEEKKKYVELGLIAKEKYNKDVELYKNSQQTDKRQKLEKDASSSSSDSGSDVDSD